MMSVAELFIAEFEQEAGTTRRFFERLPEDKLMWKPHEKSNTAGALALHMAAAPGSLAAAFIKPAFDMSGGGPTFVQPSSLAEILATHDASIKAVGENLRKLSDADFAAAWPVVAGGKTLMSLPRGVMVRMFMMNHIIQHRGQLAVYLRLLGCKVPYSYGPSGDESPFTM
jgi:uncharacterized damage-inducible protein DinB